MKRGFGLGLFAIAVAGAASAAEPIPIRTPIASFTIAPSKPVSRVETNRVDFAPGQVMPAHVHPVPVICFVSKGDFLVSIGDAPERRAPFGSATYEPAGVTVHAFKNASATEPAQLLCALLAGPDDKVLSIMLDH